MYICRHCFNLLIDLKGAEMYPFFIKQSVKPIGREVRSPFVFSKWVVHY